MKIHGDRPSGVQDAGQAQQVEKAAQQRAQQARGGADSGDRVQVSADARLLGQAVEDRLVTAVDAVEVPEGRHARTHVLRRPLG